MSIKNKGIITVQHGKANTQELDEILTNLSDGEYGYLLFDKEKNRVLPQLKYLFGVVLKTISKGLPDFPPTDALYSFFAERFGPRKCCQIHGKSFNYFSFKNLQSSEMGRIINEIIHYAHSEWNIDIPTRDDLRNSEASEPYLNAYAEQWKDFSIKI